MRAAVLLAVFLSASPALAEDCSHLTLLGSLDMVPTPENLMIVPVTIDGAMTQMLLDTGGGISSVSQKTVKALDLKPQDSRMKLLDMGGNASRRFVRVDTLQLDRLKGKDIDLMIWPSPNIGFDGIIAGDLLGGYDVELDFGAHKLNLFSHEHCEDRVVYWPAKVLAVVPFSMVRPVSGNPGNPPSVQTARDTHIRVPVTIDGKAFSAIIDTGASFTTMSAGAARYRMGITADSPGAVPLGVTNSNPDEKSFAYIFGRLDFEGVTVTNPRVLIHPDLIGKKDPDNTYTLGSAISRADDEMRTELVIGMDVLTRLHLYIAYSERKLYITPPDQPGATTAGP